MAVDVSAGIERVVDGPAVGRKRRPRVPAAARREQLLDVAADLVLSEEGVSSVTLQRVAQIAEINHATIYRFFRNRDDLLLALLEREAGSMETAVVDGLEGADLEERMRSIMASLVDPRRERATTIEDRIASFPARSPELRAWQDRRNSMRVAFLANLLRDEQPELTAQQAVILAAALSTALAGAFQLASVGMSRALIVETMARLAVGGAAEVAKRPSETRDD